MNQPGWKPNYTYLKQEIWFGLAVVTAFFAVYVATQTRLWFGVICFASPVDVYVLLVRRGYKRELWDRELHAHQQNENHPV